MSPRPPTWLISLVVVVYSSLFFLFILKPANSVKDDSLTYIVLAKNISEHHVFSQAITPPFVPDVYRLPVYPLFLAAVHANTPSSIHIAIALQCAMGIALVFIVWPFWKTRSTGAGALCATFVLCFDIMTILHQDLVMTEAIYNLIFTVALCGGILYLESPTRRHAAMTGLAYGLAALIKPIAIIPAGLFIFFSYKNKNWRSLGWLVVFSACLPALWVARNWTITGQPVFTIQGNYEMLNHPAASVLAVKTGQTRHQALADLEKRLQSEGYTQQTDPVTLSRGYKRLGIHVLAQYPLGTIDYWIVQEMRILGGMGLEMILDQLPYHLPREGLIGKEFKASGQGTMALLKAYPVLIPLQIAYSLFVLVSYILFGRAILKFVRNGEWRLAVFYAGSVILILIVSAVPGGTYRLRIPLIPLFAFAIAASFAPAPLRKTA